MPYTPSERTPGTDDWLCSRCGQVSNHSEPCYDCDRKEREANPILPPPPAPGWPIAYRSRKQKTKREDRQPSLTSYTVSSSRPKPSKTPYTRGWSTLRKPQPNYFYLAILLFIDWLNRLAGAEKPKEKTNGEQMATFEELFEDYEDVDSERGTNHTTGGD